MRGPEVGVPGTAAASVGCVATLLRSAALTSLLPAAAPASGTSTFPRTCTPVNVMEIFKLQFRNGARNSSGIDIVRVGNSSGSSGRSGSGHS